MKKIGSIIRSQRMNKHISQTELATLLGCSQVKVSRIERGTSGVNHDLLAKLSYYLGLRLPQPTGYPLLNQTSALFINQVENLLANYRYDELHRVLSRPDTQELLQFPFMQKIYFRLKGLTEYHRSSSFISAVTHFTTSLSLPVFSEFDKYFDAETYNAYANCLAEIGQPAQAKKFYQKSLAVIDTIHPVESGNIRVRALLNLSKLMRKERDTLLAQRYLDEAMAINKKKKRHYLMCYLYYQQVMIANDCNDLALCKWGLQNSMLFSHASHFSGMSEYELAMNCVLQMNQQDIWEYNDVRLSECSNAQIFHLYGQL